MKLLVTPEGSFDIKTARVSQDHSCVIPIGIVNDKAKVHFTIGSVIGKTDGFRAQNSAGSEVCWGLTKAIFIDAAVGGDIRGANGNRRFATYCGANGTFSL